jgi:hypothetical protein
MSKQLPPTGLSPSLRSSKGTLILPILLIGLGSGWLLTTLGFGPGIDWVWTLGLAAIGILAFAVSGLDKVSIVVGPLFLLASGLSLLRQQGHVPIDVELPVLIIAAGILLLVSRSSAIPVPKWLLAEGRHS